MNIGSFMHNGAALYGVFEDGFVSAPDSGFLGKFPTLRDVLDAGRLDDLRALGQAKISIEEITFLPPIPNPRKIICVGMNYQKPYPVDGVAPPAPENIILFGKEREAMVGHGAQLETPRGEPAQSFDYEGEIAVVIGRKARHVSPAQAMDHILGFSAFNDGSVRAWQKHSIYAGKNFAKSGAWGPWITTSDALPPPDDLRLTVELNGEVMQDTFGKEMIFGVADQIAYASQLFTLRPGDVIATGSPDGTGGSRNPKRYLKRGDVLVISVSGVGSNRNAVV